jgi:biotin synthase
MLPDRNLMVAGGKEVVFGGRLAEVLDAGINALMVGNYLTSLGTSGDFWQDQAARRGLALGPE